MALSENRAEANLENVRRQHFAYRASHEIRERLSLLSEKMHQT